MTSPRRVISDIAEVNPRLPAGLTSDLIRRVDFVPMADLSENGAILPKQNRLLSEVLKGYTYFENGDVIVAKITPCMENGKAAYVDNLPCAIGFGSTEFHVLRPKRGIDGQYLFWMLWGPHFRDRAHSNMTGSAGQKRVPAGFFDRYDIPVPPLADQRRIAAILNAANALRAKRRASIDQLDAIVQSTFLEMFGNPVRNPKGWQECKFGDVIERLEGGKNVAPSDAPSEYRILKVSAVTYGEYRPEEAKWLPPDFRPPASYIVRASDLLISRANTVDLIGATAYVWETPEKIVLPDKIWRFVWKKNAPINSLYVFHMSRHKDFQQMIGTRASGTSGSMKNISKPKLLGLTIQLPPLHLQELFAARFRRMREQRARLVKQLIETDALFASLQSQAFKGGLPGSSALTLPVLA